MLLAFSAPSHAGELCGWAWGSLRSYPKAELSKVPHSVALPLEHGEPRPISTSEGTLAQDLKDRILPFIARGTTGTFQGEKGVDIHYQYWEVPNAKGTLVLSHGAGESIASWREYIFNLAEQGYNVYMLDHRGHGRSGRIARDPNMLYVDRFENYVKDLSTFVEQVVVPNGHENFFLLGNSMGGAIAGRYAELHPERVKKLALTVPMMQIKFPFGLPDRGAQLIGHTAGFIGQGEHYAFGEGKPNDLEYQTYDPGSRKRALVEARVTAPDATPTVRGASFHWVAEAVGGAREVRENAHRLTMPVLFVKAENDSRVRNDAIEATAARVPNARVVELPNTPHDIVSMEDRLRDPLMRTLFEFLAAP